MTRTSIFRLLIIVAVIYLGLPYYHSYSLYYAIQDGDQVVLDERVDFDSVRKSLKDQLNTMLVKEVTTNKEIEDNPFAKMLSVFMTKFIDTMLDVAITPAGLSQIVNEGRLSENTQLSDKLDFELDDIDYAFFSSPTSFIIEKSDVTFRLKFKDWGWMLTNIYISKEALDMSGNTSNLSTIQNTKSIQKDNENDKKAENFRNKIRDLENKRSKHQEFSGRFEIHNPKFYWQTDDFGGEPIIEFTVVNNTGVPISRLFFHGKVVSGGRSIPWIDEEFNYSVPGGLENGEKKHLRLAPNIFGEWGNKETKNRKDLILEVTVVNADGANEEELVDDFDKYDAKKLEETHQSLSKLKLEMEQLNRDE